MKKVFLAVLGVVRSFFVSVWGGVINFGRKVKKVLTPDSKSRVYMGIAGVSLLGSVYLMDKIFPMITKTYPMETLIGFAAGFSCFTVFTFLCFVCFPYFLNKAFKTHRWEVIQELRENGMLD